MIQNPDAQVFQMFPIPLYVTSYKGDTSEFIKYFDSVSGFGMSKGYPL